MRWLEPSLALPAGVQVLSTTRGGGVSTAPFDSFNLGDHVGDEVRTVRENRLRLQRRIGVPHIQWLRQVHGVAVHRATTPVAAPVPEADAVWSGREGVALAIMTADCVPVVLWDSAGLTVAAAHCGWRGAAAGVLESLLGELPGVPEDYSAWLGPSICGRCYEVGEDVRSAVGWAAAFTSRGGGKYGFDLPSFVEHRLTRLGVADVQRSAHCSYHDPEFYSYRRDGRTGRGATLIWRRSEDRSEDRPGGRSVSG